MSARQPRRSGRLRTVWASAFVFVLALGALVACGEPDPPTDPAASPSPTPNRPHFTATPAGKAPTALEASEEHVDFGRVCAPDCDAEVRVLLTGAGEPISVEDDGSEGLENERVFSASSDCAGVTLQADRRHSCTLRVRFHPHTRGDFSARLEVLHSGAATPLIITLNGVGECSEDVPADRLALLDERVGFGRNASGGAEGCLYHVRNADDSGPGSLREGAEMGGQWVVFDDDFTIRLDSNLMVAGDTTIDGRGRRVVIEGRGVHLEGASASNVILENLHIQHADGDSADSGNDLLRAWLGASDFWFDHLTLADAQDEYIDIGRTEDGRTEPVFGTISWVRFEAGGPISDDEKAVIIGAPAGVETNALLHITLHHNWYNGTRQRHPLVTSAYAHSFNNVIRWRLWGMQARRDEAGDDGSTLVSEHDVFDAELAPDGRRNGVRIVRNRNHVRVTDPLLLHNASIRESGADGVSDPREFYPYELDPVDEVVAIVTAGAGAR